MTNKEMSQLYYLDKEIRMHEQRLHELEQVAHAPRVAALTGMPRPQGAGDPTARVAAEIADLKTIIEDKMQQCRVERNRLEQYITTVDDSLTRLILTYRYVDALSWDTIAERVGGKNTPEGVQKRCYRYLKDHEEDAL